MSGPLLSVIVPTRDRRELLLAKLDTLSKQTLPDEAFEVIVCDDGSRDGSRQAVEQADTAYRLELVETQGGAGPAAARNSASERARGEYLLMSDDDCLLTPGALEAHVEAQRKQANCVVIGPLRLPADTAGAGREPFEQVSSLAGRASWINATGANSSIPTALFRRAGGYDESFVGYGGEDPDLALRLRELGAGFRFEPRALVYHAGRQLAGDFESKAYSAGRAHWRVYRRYGSPEVGMALGVHPLMLTMKRALLNRAVGSLLGGPRFRYEHAYLRGALSARREENRPHASAD